ncbi:DUF3147 family protein [Candidatus Margulisiibacteriota bacterium]
MIFVKIIVSALIITILSETAKKYTNISGFLAAMPITTLMILIWLYIEKRDVVLLSNFSKSVFWAIIPSLLFFIPPILLFKKGWNFYLVLSISFALLWVGFLIHRKLVV